jgi:RNA polymerase sigma-70 factor, ECF subfamily
MGWRMTVLQDEAIDTAEALMQPENAEPEELARRAQSGCVVSYAELARRFRPRLLHVLERRLGGCVEDAEDVTQEALARAWGRIGHFDGRGRFSTWLFTIALRAATDHHRRSGRRVASTAECQSADSREGPEATVHRRELSENLWGIAGRVLSESQYTVLWLRYGEGMSVGEVAQVVRKTSLGTRVLLHRARTLLKPHIARLADVEGGES